MLQNVKISSVLHNQNVFKLYFRENIHQQIFANNSVMITTLRSCERLRYAKCVEKVQPNLHITNIHIYLHTDFQGLSI